MLTFTVVDIDNTERVYQGFTRLKQSAVGVGEWVAIAWVDGEPELWEYAANQPNTLDELRRYYSDTWPGHVVPIQIFQCTFIEP